MKKREPWGKNPRQRGKMPCFAPGMSRLENATPAGIQVAFQFFMAIEVSPDSITAENFPLTEAIHLFLEQNLKRIRSVLPKEVRVKVTVSCQKHRVFTTTFQARMKGSDLVAHGASRDFHRAVTKSRNQLIRQINDRRRRGLATSRKARHVSTPPKLADARYYE